MQLKCVLPLQLTLVSGMQPSLPQWTLAVVLGLNYNIGKLLASQSYIGSCLYEPLIYLNYMCHGYDISGLYI